MAMPVKEANTEGTTLLQISLAISFNKVLRELKTSKQKLNST